MALQVGVLMKTKPILFNTEMVRALLDGRKTQTRRIIKPQPGRGVDHVYSRPDGLFIGCHLPAPAGVGGGNPFPCPYGKPGDLLYVKEVCWMWGRWLEDGKTKTGHQAWRFEADQHDPRTVFDKPDWTVKRNGDVGWVYRHARFMPRKASHLTLRITDVRVERVQDITESEALAEGIKGQRGEKVTITNGTGLIRFSQPIIDFADLWNSIHGPDAWDRNDWVWVIEFEVIKQNVDDLIAGASNYAGVTV